MRERVKPLGICALECQGDLIRRNNDIVMRGALDDLESLMSRAKEMVGILSTLMPIIITPIGCSGRIICYPAFVTTIPIIFRGF